MRALQTAATGMMAQELNIEVISNNIANMRTTAFKRQRINFQDLLYDAVKRAGAPSSEQGDSVPAGIYIGSGVKTVSTPRVMSQGSLSPTKKPFDLAIRGGGFYQVALPDGRISYTRDGSFELDGDGRLTNADGYPIEPAMTIPEGATSVNINAQGVISITTEGNADNQEIGQIQLVQFINNVGLESIGDNLYIETESSGSPITGTPGSNGFGDIQQGYLEDSNVNAVSEITAMIAAQRAYEMSAKVISAADQMLSATSQIIR